ncbi:hypothetical protein Q8A73_011219 [Channa argus]|nr:hypothetical protein Q8A73_011219 [Channa argus]
MNQSTNCCTESPDELHVTSVGRRSSTALPSIIVASPGRGVGGGIGARIQFNCGLKYSTFTLVLLEQPHGPAVGRRCFSVDLQSSVAEDAAVERPRFCWSHGKQMHLHMLFPKMIPCLVEMEEDTEQDTGREADGSDPRDLSTLICVLTQVTRGGS